MTATPRTRSKQTMLAGKRIRTSDGYTWNLSRDVLTAQCTDVVNNRLGNNPLKLLTTTVTGGRLSGGENRYGIRTKYFDYPCTSCYAGSMLIPYDDSFVNKYKTVALARTGISAPITNLPLFIVELKDIPSMLMHAGHLLHGISRPTTLSPLKEAAAATLAYQFGWAPLISDIKKLVKFQDAVNKRLNQIDNAFHNASGYHGTSTIDRLVSTTRNDSFVVHQQDYVYIQGSEIIETRQRVWADVPWTPKALTRQIGYEAAKAAAFRSALGLNLGNIPLTTWKLLPWSWFIDWFANLSDSLQATHNLTDYVAQPGCIMVNKVVTTTHTAGSNIGVTCSEYKRIQELKQRFVVDSWGTGRPTLKLPTIDSFKLSVLGSLAILKIGK